MSECTVTTQAELDQALADNVDYVYIKSAEGVWVTLRDSGSSHVEAWESSHVEAGGFTAVHLHSARARVEGGVVIDITAVDLKDAQTWCDMQGIAVEDGQAVVYKAVKVLAKDWKPDGQCGAGLHFGPTPRHAKAYHESATRFLACRIPIAHACGINDDATAKIKARSCEVLYEVDLDGVALPVEAVTG